MQSERIWAISPAGRQPAVNIHDGPESLRPAVKPTLPQVNNIIKQIDAFVGIDEA